ncbi:hypothetical protein VFPFJ_01452 [Purpureocillium lilacinum]|uniref:Uncharacterized protein n=1 Tax=Purpureocillium lilacinum TaxID=33203 RepID=A0A179HAS2_PURLI|nr:hypothetical protein VFPFJ_01452 [Purpureocillium lilacinum]OAQ87385.1 hypothetical protein VFPBJ_01425 [Purpureocillium lilacinum]OAQ95342.1 hypothetical protein VFPFJ_01452 [Purpureocillium lilacinum]
MKRDCAFEFFSACSRWVAVQVERRGAGAELAVDGRQRTRPGGQPARHRDRDEDQSIRKREDRPATGRRRRARRDKTTRTTRRQRHLFIRLGRAWQGSPSHTATAGRVQIAVAEGDTLTY